MAAESTRIAKAGDPLRISARKWNALNGLLGERPTRLPGMGLLTDSETLILVRNDTGDALEPFKIVKVGDSLPLPTLNESEWKYRRVFEGESPAASEMFAVTQDGIGTGDLGPALILGVTTCTLNVQDAADTHASPGTSTDDLDTGTSGPAVILWKESGTGAGKKAKVLLTGLSGSASRGVEVVKVVAGASNSFGEPAVRQQWDAAAGTWSALDAIEVRLKDPNGGTFAEDDYAVAKGLGPNASDVSCFAAVPPGGGGATLAVETDIPGSTITGTFANPSVTTTTAMLVLPTSGIWQLTLNMCYTCTISAVYLTYYLREMAYGGGPASGSLVFFGPGAIAAGDHAFWTFVKGITSAEQWTVTTYVTATEDECQIGFDSSSTGSGSHTDTFFGTATQGMSLTALRVGDAPPP